MKNQKDTIRKVIGHLNNEDADGGFWLPNIQRPFVWSEDQIQRLFDSIMRQYPISTLLVWKTTSEIKHRRFIDNWKGSLRLTDFYVPSNDKTKRLVLDGQQRLQSLFIGLKGSYEAKELYFDALSGDLVAPEDIRYRFRFLEPNQAQWPWVRFKDIVFSSLTPNKLVSDLEKRCPQLLGDDQKDRLDDNIGRARQEFCQDENIAYQELDSLDEPGAYQEEDVVEIFIRANSGGTKLGKSDLLFSLLTSTWDDADLAMEELIDDLNKSGFAFDRDFVLKTCLSILGKGARYQVDKFRDGTTKEQIVARWKEISAAIRDVKDFVAGKTFIRHDKMLPSYLALIPLIYFRFHFPAQWGKATRMDEYLLRTLVTSAFGGSPDNLIDQLTKNITEQKDFVLNEIFGTVLANGRSLDVTESMILGQTYGSREIHLYLNLWYAGFNYQPAFVNNQPQVDHIFPQSMLKKIKVENPQTGKHDLMRYKWEDRDQFANLMLLTAKENGAGGKTDTPPEEWFTKRMAEEGDGYLTLHLIPKERELWKIENFERFIKAREKLILNKFSFMLHKSTGA
jgi:hypothetical protein